MLGPQCVTVVQADPEEVVEESGQRRGVMQSIDTASPRGVAPVEEVARAGEHRTSWQEASTESQGVVEVRACPDWQPRREVAGPKASRECRRWTTTMHGARGEPVTVEGARWSVAEIGKPEPTGEAEVGLEGEGPALTVEPQVGQAEAVEDGSPESKSSNQENGLGHIIIRKW